MNRLPTWLENRLEAFEASGARHEVRVVDGPSASTVEVLVDPRSFLSFMAEIRSILAIAGVHVVHWRSGPGPAAEVRVTRSQADGLGEEHCTVRLRSKPPTQDHPPRHGTATQWRRRWGVHSAMSSAGRSASGGLNIVLYGPDGVGKSSAAETLARSLRDHGVPDDQVLTYHAFIETADLQERAGSTGTAVKVKTYSRARRPLVRTVLLTMAFVKRLVIRGLKVRPRLRRGAIVIHDRYLLDVFLKSQKTHPEPLPLLEGLLSRFVPTTDLVFVLRADPEVVSSRTGELNPKEVQAAYELLDRCLQASSKHVDIDANRPTAEVDASLLRHVLAEQTRRFHA
jgi:thymidylate kinase